MSVWRQVRRNLERAGLAQRVRAKARTVKVWRDGGFKTVRATGWIDLRARDKKTGELLRQ